jgi:hypothetical protein
MTIGIPGRSIPDYAVPDYAVPGAIQAGSVEAAIYAILSGYGPITALVGGAKSPRIYPLGIPQGKSVPALVYQQVSSSDEESCDGPLGPRTDRVQVTSWDDDPDGARLLAEAVRRAMTTGWAAGNNGTLVVTYCRLLDEGDAYDVNEENESLTRYGKRQDWEIAYEA